MILMFLFLIVTGIVLACKDRYDVNEEVLIYDIIEKEGEGASCNLTLYKGGVLNQSNWMNRTGLSYKYNASKLTREIYSAGIECNKTTGNWEGECKFKVGEEIKMWEIMIGLILGLITFIMFYLLKTTENFDMKVFWGSFGFFFIVVDFWFLYRAVLVLSGEPGIVSNILRMYEISLIMFKIYFWLLCVYFMLRVILTLFDWRKKKREKKEAWPFMLE
jgi:hypothetical protein